MFFYDDLKPSKVGQDDLIFVVLSGFISRVCACKITHKCVCSVKICATLVDAKFDFYMTRDLEK